MKYLIALAVHTFLLRSRREPNLFQSLETCNKAYEELYAQCVKDGKSPDGIKAPPQYDRDADKETSSGDADAGEGGDGGGSSPPPPIRHRDVGGTTEADASPTYHPPREDGEASAQEGYDYLHHGDDWPSMCQSGPQSPIDIAKDIDINGQTKYVLWFDYYADPDRQTKNINAYLENNGHGVSFTAPENLDLGYLKLGHSEYTAVEYNFHAPSEHTIDGATFPLELQILNKGKDGKLLAVAFFFREGSSNVFLNALKVSSHASVGPKWSGRAEKKGLNSAVGEAFNLDQLLPKSEDHPGGDLTFYNYEGSLTQPPCTPGVEWWVSAKPLAATKDEIRFIKRAILESESTKHGNNRDIQPSNGRRIMVGMTNFQHSVKMPGLPGNQQKDSVQQPRGFASGDTPWVAE